MCFRKTVNTAVRDLDQRYLYQAHYCALCTVESSKARRPLPALRTPSYYVLNYSLVQLYNTQQCKSRQVLRHLLPRSVACSALRAHCFLWMTQVEKLLFVWASMDSQLYSNDMFSNFNAPGA